MRYRTWKENEGGGLLTCSAYDAEGGNSDIGAAGADMAVAAVVFGTAGASRVQSGGVWARDRRRQGGQRVQGRGVQTRSVAEPRISRFGVFR